MAEWFDRRSHLDGFYKIFTLHAEGIGVRKNTLIAMLELLFSKTPKEEKKKFYMVTLIVWIILLICMLLMDFHIISDTEPNSIMYAVIIFGMINSIVQVLRKE